MRPQEERHFDRRLSQVLIQLIVSEPVIALHGPRAVGKSTLVNELAHNVNAIVVDLDDPTIREAAAASPTNFVSEGRVFIDEYQHVPETLDALKARLNTSGALPGTAVLTGSTRHDALPRTAQALTGRLHTRVIWPLSRAEIDGVDNDLISQLLGNADTTSSETRVPQ